MIPAELYLWHAERPDMDVDAALAQAAKLFPGVDAGRHRKARERVDGAFGAASRLAEEVRSRRLTDAKAVDRLRREFPELPDDVRSAALARGYFESR